MTPVLDYIEINEGAKRVAVDEDGYLVNFDDWDESVARALAERTGFGELTGDRIEILKFIREHYKKYNFFPILRAVCKYVNKPRDCMIDEFEVPLVAWKLAGLPHPEEPVISLLEAGQTPT
ncbi:MAG TPA: TusE/DsrC/DsvC family sulfur relay protein [Nitrospirota bacterium]|jgi:TusE/DsrC/DsvC family sulfur relay protein|nr:TusE/DsrC/DsvC family sulfur relay protein [Nitrospirota bacterium]